jgi:hypothetical protein
LEDRPQLNGNGIHVRRASLRAARECEATQPGKVPAGRPAASPSAGPCVGGAVAEPAGEPNKGQRLAGPLPGFYQLVTDWTGIAAVRKNEERKKHDRLSAFHQAAKDFTFTYKINSIKVNALRPGMIFC